MLDNSNLLLQRLNLAWVFDVAATSQLVKAGSPSHNSRK